MPLPQPFPLSRQCPLATGPIILNDTALMYPSAPAHMRYMSSYPQTTVASDTHFPFRSLPRNTQPAPQFVFPSALPSQTQYTITTGRHARSLLTSCRAIPPAKILIQGDAAQRQWLAQHYRGLHAPGLLSPDTLQPAGLQSCSHCHKVYTQGGMSRHENLCEDRPEATAPTPPPNSSDPDPFTDVALEFLEDLELDGPTFQRCAGQSIVHPPRGAKIHIIACFDALFSRLPHNLDDIRLWKLFFALPAMLFAPFPRNAKTAHAPQSQTSIMRRRCKIFLQGDFETLWNSRTGRTPPPSPRTAQYAHKELTDIVRELVQEGSLSRAASRIFSSGPAPASLDTVQLLIGKCPAANPHTFPDQRCAAPGRGAYLHHHTRLCYPA